MPATTTTCFSNADLQRQLDELRAEGSSTIPLERIGSVVAILLDSLTVPDGSDFPFRAELAGIAETIRAAKADIAALSAPDGSGTFVTRAQDELDAVVEATETATNTILDMAEIIDATVATAPAEIADRLSMAATRIFEACNFQDITGQRIAKVVGTLKTVEARIDHLVAVVDAAAVRGGDAPASPADADAALLNGPQLGGVGVNQDDVDDLFGKP